MTAPLFLALVVAGGLGAVLRFVVDGAMRVRWPRPFPLGTAMINVTGSFVLGLLTGLGQHAHLPHGWVLVLGTGAMGGYTTFSTASVETVRLIQTGRYALALLTGAGVMLLALAAAWAGLTLGGR